MTDSPATHEPPIAPGLCSLVLGAVGLLLFALPVLGIPLGILGLAFGALGMLAAVGGGRTALRWAIAGVIVSGLAFSLAAAIAFAPAGLLNTQNSPVELQRPPTQPFVPPPANGGETWRQVNSS